MAKKITITLSARAEKYFNKVSSELDDGEGKSPSNSRIINESLEALVIFEYSSGDFLLGWLMENYPHLFDKHGQFAFDSKL